jgi:uncharacterized protein (DUF342 family)
MKTHLHFGQKYNLMNFNMIGNNQRNLLALAVKCRLISDEQEKKISSLFADELNKDPNYSIVQIFREKKYLSNEEIDFLFAVKKHLEIKMLDKKFGELGVANKFINSESVKQALDLQDEIFKETRKSKLLGNILFDQKKITKANKAAILLTQDRVEDESLAEAINDIASTEMEKISINMRFGAIAVKKNIISLEQLNQALKLQKDEERENQPKRYLGEILIEFFGLSAKDSICILKIQKEFEKQKLSLERALSFYNPETNTNKRLNRIFEYRFSKNKLTAYIRIATEMTEPVLVSEVITWLSSISISSGILDEKFIEDFLNKGVIGLEIEIAKGYAPSDPENESIEFLFNTGPGTKSDKRNSQKTGFVKKGDIMAKRIPYKEGKPGKDVCGFHIAPSEYKTIPLSCGEGVVKKGNHFLAAMDGNPVLFKNRTLFVTPGNQDYPTEYYSGHITTDLGLRYQTSNLKVDGNIETGGKVTCNGITVKGDVKGQIRATGSVQINGNAINNPGKEPPHIISSDEDIIVKKNIVNTIIITSKTLSAPASDLISSKVYVFQDIILKNIYSKEDNPSILQIGKNPSLKVNAINQSIDDKKQALKGLLHKNELEEIENWFNGKIQMQNDYLEQQTILKDLLKLISDKAFKKFETFEQKTGELLRRIDETACPESSEILESANCKKFITELLNDTRDKSEEKLKAHLEELLDIKFGMYKAAVNATKKYKQEYTVQKETVWKKIEKHMPEITEIKMEIDDLYVKKDYLRMSESKLIPSINPTIRVKNQVDKGTVIKGWNAALIIDKTMFGVKFSEKQKAGADKPEIVIEGFYE